ncbi:hypothetical protein ACPPVO_54605 [Dactylosporangium sp. McL0621]|uniref:hypothetical protein n=1 Tax=Dactylosporangium sp. McL0621 TaxID=3415678 RepID=UPI003CE71E21
MTGRGRIAARRFEQVSVLFRALAVPVRLAIVELLIVHYGLQVHEIVAAIVVTQALGLARWFRGRRCGGISVEIEAGSPVPVSVTL